MAKTTMNQKSTDYRIISPLAIGGMAKVDLAENIETSNQVVFKRIRTDFKLREDMQELFKEEQKLNRHLKSPHVVRMIADGTDEGGPYMIFEWVDGTDLEQVLAGVSAKENPLPLNQALLISYYMAQGLAYLHGLQNDQGGNLGLIHRDLSPGNILISNQGEVKIADFGIAKSVIKETQTVVGELKGKFAYMAPEQTHGDEMDHRVDLFALGIVMWECCMAQSLFDAKNNMDVVQRVRERQAPTLITLRNEVPEELSNLVHELLEKDADRRPANSQEVVERLEQIVYAQGLFDGHKRILAQLARQYPRNISFDHVPSGGETQKVTTDELKKPQNIVVKDIPEAMAPITTQVVASNSKGLFFIGLGIMALLGVLIGLNLSSSQTKVPAPPAARTKAKPTAIAPSNPPIEIATPTSVPTPAPQTVQSPKLKKKSTVPPKKPAAAAGFGTFQLTSSPWGWVEIDGKKLEKHTPIRGLQISSGEHQVRIFNPELELERVFKINVRANEKLQKKVNLSTGTIR
jgi:serine/threonine protein kinase